MLSYVLRSTFFYALFVVTVCGTGKAEVREASVPSLGSTPTIQSVTTRNSFKRLLKTKQGTITEQENIKTNGTVLDQGNIVVDNIVEPRCVFYGNYNDIAGDISQSFSIDTIIFECK
ncbi:MAG: hypothetical protein D3905_08390 [Candidatus Electrothrix sp. AS4_5]|jgi:hypothetical protein|nr:hypothetical protein [Candidatus Electrothrix gigas]MCI5189804.1 hypothetical protein [Candidatus Electrothrix gigas]